MIPSSSAPPKDRRTEILAEFERRIAEQGIAAVVMADLARDLGISTKTLYREFRTKAELVQALLDKWTRDLEDSQQARIDQIADPVARLKAGISEIHTHLSRFSPTFWCELRDRFPEQQADFDAVISRARGRAVDWIGAATRDGLDRSFALELLGDLVHFAVEPRRCDRLGLTSGQALGQAIEIWASGAFERPVTIQRSATSP